MKFQEFLDKWRFNKTLLAQSLGLSTSGFYNKLSEKNADKITDDQKKVLEKLLKEDLKKDLDNLQF